MTPLDEINWMNTVRACFVLVACCVTTTRRLYNAPNHAHRADIVNIGRPKSDKESKDATELKPPPRSLPWAMLLRRVFAIDVLKCDSCSGTIKILAIVPASDAEETLEQALPQPSDVQPQATSPPSVTEMNCIEVRLHHRKPRPLLVLNSCTMIKSRIRSEIGVLR